MAIRSRFPRPRFASRRNDNLYETPDLRRYALALFVVLRWLWAFFQRGTIPDPALARITG